MPGPALPAEDVTVNETDRALMKPIGKPGDWFLPLP